jgi:hypothetical protein
MILDMSLLRYGICVSRTKKDTPRSNENQAFAGLPSTVGNAVVTRAETKQAAHPVDRDIKCRQSKQHKHRGVIKLPVITMLVAAQSLFHISVEPRLSLPAPLWSR